ncbi:MULTISPECIES: DUF642 domain-containing protein [unclassified Nostoc]|uniref:DUF642 domain-containing protein n=1 Tax=unclassified Nostoc TaxID=2593658 RepID=UPI002AD39F72|nr:DUF642 domain-containing protein [Nostoc sp. DedQUE03]MDZ7974192.1 DUF642 domain-containing protein [Nostoc sp. DedQUE03]MDZ8042847.1 DUF642 domain-containing protein [Nostoc sp. DedQUE02]
MKFTKKLSIIVCSLTTAFLYTAVITNTYKSAAQAEGQELIINGGFEIDPLVDPNDPNIVNSNVTAWVKSGELIDISGITISNFPHTGNQGLSLGSFSGISYISQTIPTIPGQHYQLTYYFASIEEAPNLKNKFKVFIGGKKVSVQNDTPYQPYTQYTLDFKAKATSTEIKFASKAKYGFLYLDDVSVKATPEHQGENYGDEVIDDRDD